ncbi:MAG: polysaccharide biosynthesis/export family protein [Elusimicrobia bacterium]|nr:polysaccharide biosynthesis/export family protein [Elusimicrobiota bacterium]
MRAPCAAVAAALSFCLAFEPALLAAAEPLREGWVDAQRPEGKRAGIDAELLKDRIQAGDSIAISLYPAEEYSREVVVQPDGKIQMPLIGSLMVRGMDLTELQETLRVKYSLYVDRPQVTVNVRRFAGRRIAVVGEVSKPGFFEYRDGMRLMEVVAMAGGLTIDARPARTTVLRAGPKRDQSFRVNLAAVLDGDLSRDPLLAPGDTIHIPKQPMTTGATWVNRNVLPWALLTSMIVSILLATRRR